MASDKWRFSSRQMIMGGDQLNKMGLEGIEKIDEHKKIPELESFLTVVFTYWHVGFPGELYKDFMRIRLYIWSNTMLLQKLKRYYIISSCFTVNQSGSMRMKKSL
jgi:hypothetical protein